MTRKWAPFTAVAAAILVADQASKAWVQASFALHESRPVIEGLFHLTYVRNPGAAFGLFAGHGEAFRRPFFLTVTAIALVVILVAARRLPPARSWTLAALSLVFGGALGNLVDRVRWGEVVDFLDFFWRHHHWPAFNIADSAISVGMAVLILGEFAGKKPHPDPGDPCRR